MKSLLAWAFLRRTHRDMAGSLPHKILLRVTVTSQADLSRPSRRIFTREPCRSCDMSLAYSNLSDESVYSSFSCQCKLGCTYILPALLSMAVLVPSRSQVGRSTLHYHHHQYSWPFSTFPTAVFLPFQIHRGSHLCRPGNWEHSRRRHLSSVMLR
jgi:hypothetical protein